MKAITISVVVLATILAIVFVEFEPKPAVVTPEVQKTGDYKRPVREGNCWRQFTATDSVLVCH